MNSRNDIAASVPSPDWERYLVWPGPGEARRPPAPAFSFPRGPAPGKRNSSTQVLVLFVLVAIRFRTPPHTPRARETNNPYRRDEHTGGGPHACKPRTKPTPGSGFLPEAERGRKKNGNRPRAESDMSRATSKL